MTAIRDEGQELMTLAGFWGTTMTKTGERDSFNMITVPANQFMTQFHGANDEKRMPAIIPITMRDECMSLDTSPEDALNLLKPYRSVLAKVDEL